MDTAQPNHWGEVNQTIAGFVAPDGSISLTSIRRHRPNVYFRLDTASHASASPPAPDTATAAAPAAAASAEAAPAALAAPAAASAAAEASREGAEAAAPPSLGQQAGRCSSVRVQRHACNEAWQDSNKLYASLAGFPRRHTVRCASLEDVGAYDAFAHGLYRALPPPPAAAPTAAAADAAVGRDAAGAAPDPGVGLTEAGAAGGSSAAAAAVPSEAAAGGAVVSNRSDTGLPELCGGSWVSAEGRRPDPSLRLALCVRPPSLPADDPSWFAHTVTLRDVVDEGTGHLEDSLVLRALEEADAALGAEEDGKGGGSERLPQLCVPGAIVFPIVIPKRIFVPGQGVAFQG